MKLELDRGTIKLISENIQDEAWVEKYHFPESYTNTTKVKLEAQACTIGNFIGLEIFRIIGKESRDV